MSDPCTVIVGAPELHDALRRHAGVDGEVVTFSDRDPLKALEIITTRRPRVVALERLFAATSRGAALITRIKADPALSAAEIRIVSHDGTYARVSPRRAPAAQPAADGGSDAGGAVETIAPPAAGLDFRGTRRAVRVRVAAGTAVQVDGVPGEIVDLSTVGAQILSPIPLKPAQLIRLALADDRGVIRCNGSVAWVSLEIPKGVSRYRAGVEFRGADASPLDAFCKRHAL